MWPGTCIKRAVIVSAPAASALHEPVVSLATLLDSKNVNASKSSPFQSVFDDLTLFQDPKQDAGAEEKQGAAQSSSRKKEVSANSGSGTEDAVVPSVATQSLPNSSLNAPRLIQSSVPEGSEVPEKVASQAAPTHEPSDTKPSSSASNAPATIEVILASHVPPDPSARVGPSSSAPPQFNAPSEKPRTEVRSDVGTEVPQQPRPAHGESEPAAKSSSNTFVGKSVFATPKAITFATSGRAVTTAQAVPPKRVTAVQPASVPAVEPEHLSEAPEQTRVAQPATVLQSSSVVPNRASAAAAPPHSKSTANPTVRTVAGLSKTETEMISAPVRSESPTGNGTTVQESATVAQPAVAPQGSSPTPATLSQRTGAHFSGTSTDIQAAQAHVHAIQFTSPATSTHVPATPAPEIAKAVIPNKRPVPPAPAASMPVQDAAPVQSSLKFAQTMQTPAPTAAPHQMQPLQPAVELDVATPSSTPEHRSQGAPAAEVSSRNPAQRTDAGARWPQHPADPTSTIPAVPYASAPAPVSSTDPIPKESPGAPPAVPASTPTALSTNGRAVNPEPEAASHVSAPLHAAIANIATPRVPLLPHAENFAFAVRMLGLDNSQHPWPQEQPDAPVTTSASRVTTNDAPVTQTKDPVPQASRPAAQPADTSQNQASSAPQHETHNAPSEAKRADNSDGNQMNGSVVQPKAEVNTHRSEVSALQAPGLDSPRASASLTEPAESNPPLSVHESRLLAPETPRAAAPSSQLLLHLAGGDQSLAAIRVADRAGSVTVSVHASDPVLRDSLRSNLGDLSAQLNSQGWKADVIQPAALASHSENQQEGNPSGQHSSAEHQWTGGDRQAQRDRRGSDGQWQQEFDQETSGGTGPSGGKN